MLLNEIVITDEDIDQIECTIIPNGRHFSQEQRAFIKDLTTLDLQAVPGSGKTTALIGKLLVLSKMLPFDDGSGILVISHTNNAVKNLSDVFQLHCPHLLAYPNFVGTIQSFTDTFLAIPCFRARYGRVPYRIDDDTYKSTVYIPRSAQRWIANRSDGTKILQQTKLNRHDQLVYKVLGEAANLHIGQETSTYKGLVTMKKALKERGILCFDDTYILAFDYLDKNPCIKQLLRKRFPLVFVDEMQDMVMHQYKLLEDVFVDENNPNVVVYQRIGDKNQAIYSDEIETNDIWKNRGKVLPLSTSLRLSPTIASAVQAFGISVTKITGSNESSNGLRPHVIVYDDSTMEDVIPKFCELVQQYVRSSDLKHPVKALAWTKGSLKLFFPAFQKDGARQRVHYPDLISHLVYNSVKAQSDGSLREIYDGIASALTYVLFLEGINVGGKHSDGTDRKIPRYSDLKDYLARYNPSLYEEFLLKMYRWSLNSYQGNVFETRKDIADYLPRLLVVFGGKIDKSNSFIDATSPSVEETEVGRNASQNSCIVNGVKVEIDTVHSVKGETHTATLYLESSYYKKYETEWLERRFCGISNDLSNRVRPTQCTKVIYVGFSRPTHLLCYAIHKNRFKKNVFQANWEIIDDLTD